MIIRILKYFIRFIPLLISTVIVFISLFPAGNEKLELDKSKQLSRIAALEEAYKNGEIAPVDESSFYAGNLKKDLKAGIKFNEISFIATHNSYQSSTTAEAKNLYKNLSELTFGALDEELGEFQNETLTDQLNCGIRSFEMDIEVFNRNGEISFTCIHNPYIDTSTWCYDFALGLKEIAMWSDNNPNHLPITIIIEPKILFIPFENMEALNAEHAKAFDELLNTCLQDKLFTPADMLRDYDSFADMRNADDWCKVSDMTGKILVLLHDSSITEKYIKTDPSIKSQAMFPMLRPNDSEKNCASFIISNNPKKLLKTNDNLIKNKKLIVRTRADGYTNIDETRLKMALETDAQIISTDYPVKTDTSKNNYVVTFGDYKTIRKIG